MKSKSYILDSHESLTMEKSRLPLQAEILFPIEMAYLQQHGIDDAIRILDLGCGNGTYLDLLAKQRPCSIIHGIDRNEVLLASARLNCPRAEFKSKDLNDIESIKEVVSFFTPDFVYSRFVSQHMSGCDFSKLLSGVFESCSPGTRLCLIDSDDEFMVFSPDSKELTELRNRKIARQQLCGGNRLIGRHLGRLLYENGFRSIVTTPIFISTDAIGFANWEAIILPILLSGLTDVHLKESANLIQNAKRWFLKNRANTGAWATTCIFITSGVK